MNKDTNLKGPPSGGIIENINLDQKGIIVTINIKKKIITKNILCSGFFIAFSKYRIFKNLLILINKYTAKKIGRPP